MNNEIDIFLGKIEEFNKKAGNSLQLNENQLKSLLKLCDVNTSPDEESVKTLIILLDWPKGKWFGFCVLIFLFYNLTFVFIDILFPVLDITRLAVRNKHINDVLCSDNLIMNKLLPHIYDVENPTNQMLAFRCICNLMHHEKGELLVVNYYETFLQFIQKLSNENIPQKHLQVSLLLNLFYFLI